MDGQQIDKLRDDFTKYMEEKRIYSSYKLPLENRYNYQRIFGDNDGYFLYTIQHSTSHIIILGTVKIKCQCISSQIEEHFYSLEYTPFTCVPPNMEIPMHDKRDWEILSVGLSKIIPFEDRRDIKNFTVDYQRAQNVMYNAVADVSCE